MQRNRRRQRLGGNLTVATACSLMACGAPPSSLDPGATEPDAMVAPDAAAPDATLEFLGPSLIFDDIHIASNSEEPNAFSLIGVALNSQLQQQVADGALLLGIELRNLDDPSGQDDEVISVGFYTLQDSDDDPTNNFEKNRPETFFVSSGGIVGGEPSILFDRAQIAGGRMSAEGVAALELLGGILPISLSKPELDARFIPTADRMNVNELFDGRLRGGLPMSLLALLPNITNTAGGMCQGNNLLDVIATGCGVIPAQPDVDLDDDGLEQLFDSDGDGAIDRCIDGDGSEITGTGCTGDSRIADGYRMVFAVHGVRANFALAP